jgi:hypothetical protein
MRTTTWLSAVTLVFTLGCDRTEGTGDGDGSSTSGTGTTAGTGTGTGTTATAGTGTGTGTGTGGGTGGGRACAEGPSNPDYLWEDEFEALYPATTATSYAVVAGVAEVIAAADALTDGETVEGLDLAVTNAVVTNIGYSPDGATDLSFWFGDADGFMRTFRTETGPVLPSEISRGDTVSFKVNAITSYFGEYEVTAISDFQVTGSGEPIYMLDANDTELTYAEHGRANISVYGEVTASTGECGSSNCYDLLLWNGQTVIFRVANFVEIFEGDCIWWAGPLGSFDGLQLDANELDWFAYF